ncbi:hypothetical protein D3C72_2490570 [compost metagenome]
MILAGTCSGSEIPILCALRKRISSVVYIATKMAVKIPTPPSAAVGSIFSLCGAATSKKDINASIAAIKGSSL